MIVLGFTGDIHSGKTSLANDLAELTETHRHFETSDLINEVADDLRGQPVPHPSPDNIAAINEWLAVLPASVAEHLNVTTGSDTFTLTHDRIQAHPEYYEKLFNYLSVVQQTPELQSGTITRDNKDLLRPLQQWLGGYLVAQLGGVWFNEIARRISADTDSALTTVAGVRYPADADSLRSLGGYIIEVVRPQAEELQSDDVTERSRKLIIPDSVVHNDGTLKDLRACAHTMFEDITGSRLASEYHAKA